MTSTGRDNMDSQDLLRRANQLITRANRLMDNGRMDEAMALLITAATLTDKAEALEAA